MNLNNFYTWVASTNTRNRLAQRGHNKQRRHDLRQVGLSYVLDGDNGLSLCHHVYSGNVHHEPTQASYCTGCGTMLGVHRDTAAGFNRRAIFNHDGSPYVPAKPVTNIMAKYAFDPSNVPEPKTSIIPIGMMLVFIPFGMLLSFLPNMLRFGWKVDVKKSALFPKDASKVEVVPIAWE